MANLQVGVAGNGTVTVGAGASVHSPASNTLTLGTNGDERVRITSTGNIGLGVGSPQGGGGDLSILGNKALRWSNTGGTQYGDIYADTSSNIVFRNGSSSTERVRITSGGKVLVGTSNEPSNKNTVTPSLNVSGSGVLGAAQITRHTSVGGGGALLHLAGTRGSDVNSYTILQDGDGIGTLAFNAADGNEFVTAAEVKAQVDGTPGDNDMPGRLIFTTTSDGASSSVERLRIRADGRVSIASSLAVVGVTTAAAFIPSSGQLGNKNLIINGAMNVAQRGTSATTDGFGTVDRFQCLYDGTDESPTQAQHALTSSDTGPWAKGFTNSFHITNGNQTSGAGAADSIAIFYQFEAQDIANSGWEYTSSSSKITLQFWVKSSVAQNFYGYLRSIDGTQRAYDFETGSLSANTWTKVTKTIPGDSSLQFDNNNALGFQVILYPFAGTNLTHSGRALNTWINNDDGTRTPDNTSTWYTTNDATFEITGVQLEVGSHATPFEHRSYAEELLRCQRYYQVDRSSNVNSMYESATTYNGKWYQKDHTVEMRAKPTVSTANGTNSISNSGWTGSTPTPYSSNTHTVYYSSGNAFHLAGTSDGNIGATYDSEI